VNSVNTNVAALQALQSASVASSELESTQRRLATGLRVGSVKDNGAIWAIANRQKSSATSLTTVNQSLARAAGILDVALAAGERVSDLLVKMKGLALSALDPNIDDTSRRALLEDYESGRWEIVSTIDSADFSGLNLLKSPSSADFLSNEDGSEKMTIQGQDWNYSPWTPGPVIMLRGYSLDTITYAGYAFDEVNQSIANVSASLAKLGAYSADVQRKMSFNSKLQDAMTSGVGNLVDADLGRESAKFEAQKVMQSLAQKALSIASGATQWIANLFQR